MNSTLVFRGRTVDEAQHAAAHALGERAVIHATRTIRRAGLAGLLGATEIEVAASPAGPSETRFPSVTTPFAGAAYRPESSSAAAAASNTAGLRAELRGEIRAMKSALAKSNADPEMLEEIVAMRTAIEQLIPIPRKGDRVAGTLRGHGIEGLAAATLARAMEAANDSDAPALARLRRALESVMKVAPWPLDTKGRAVITLVGATGVGKTTTVAKLAARACGAGFSVTLVAADAYRVGAAEHLGRYASLLGVAFETAVRRADLVRILGEARTDIVFVDTSGRPPQADGVESLMTRAAFASTPECRGYSSHVLLCVPAALRDVDASRVVRTFGALGATAIAVTKLDETDRPSGAVHVAVHAKRPISVLCFGQRVPEDIAPATMPALLDRIVPEAPARGGSR